jgi:hypothetical protein
MLTVIAVLLGYIAAELGFLSEIAITTKLIEAQTNKIELYTQNLRPPLSSFEIKP